MPKTKKNGKGRKRYSIIQKPTKWGVSTKVPAGPRYIGLGVRQGAKTPMRNRVSWNGENMAKRKRKRKKRK
jgi:hypothetical protein